MKGFDARFVESYRARRAAAARGEPSAAAAPSVLPRATPRRRAPVPAASERGGAPDPAARVRVVGIDTSLRCTGLAVVDATGARFEFVDCRPVPNPARRTLPECLVHIADTLERYLDEFRPDEVAMEGIFFCKNARTSLILGHARGVVVATCARRGLPMHEYPPARVKRAVTGSGSATKDQMQRMMQRVFGLPDLPQEDSADALAIALTHLHERRMAALARGLRLPDPRALR
jgi:crossover junction endodeoxyribonuclease RuvC